MIALPTTVASERRSVRGSETTTTATTTTAATAATPAAVATAMAMAAATAVASHLSETGINLLLSLSEDVNQVTSLLRIWNKLSVRDATAKMGKREYLLSVVKKVMAVPLAPARPVLPIRWM